MFLGDGLFFNNLEKRFDKYLLNDYKKQNVNFYILMKSQLKEYFINECEDLWNNYDVDKLFPMYLNEKNEYKKCMECYVLANKTCDKETQLERFPKNNLELVMDKIKSNDILFSIDKVYDVLSKTGFNDLLFVNLDMVKVEHHKKIMNMCHMLSKAVTIVYSNMGCMYLEDAKRYDVAERINETGYIFVCDNQVPF